MKRSHKIVLAVLVVFVLFTLLACGNACPIAQRNKAGKSVAQFEAECEAEAEVNRLNKLAEKVKPVKESPVKYNSKPSKLPKFGDLGFIAEGVKNVAEGKVNDNDN